MGGGESITAFNHNFERQRKKIRKKTDISEQKHVSQTKLYKSRVINTIDRYKVIKNLNDTHKYWHSPSHTHRHKSYDENLLSGNAFSEMSEQLLTLLHVKKTGLENR